MNMLIRTVQVAISLSAIIFISGCSEPQSGQTREAKSPPQVAVVTVEPSPRPIVRELPGRIAPTRVDDIRARVAGIVVERLFEQGADVKAGDVLYRIDPAKFEVELNAAQAALAKAKAAFEQATKHAKRIEQLHEGRVASQ